MIDKLRRTEQFNGREGETATLFVGLPVPRRWRRFCLTLFQRSAVKFLSGKAVCAVKTNTELKKNSETELNRFRCSFLATYTNSNSKVRIFCRSPHGVRAQTLNAVTPCGLLQDAHSKLVL